MNKKPRKLYNYYFFKKIVYLMLFFLLLTPSIRIAPSLPLIRLEEMTIVIVVAFLFIRLMRNKEIVLAWSLRQLLFSGLFVVVAISIFIGSMLGFDASIADFNQFIRVFKYLIIYSATLTLFKISQDPQEEKYNLLKYYLILSSVLFFVSIQQYFNLFALNELYVPTIAPTQYETLVNNYPFPRPVGLVGNPNELGMLFVLGSLVSLFLLLKSFRISILIIFFFQVGGLFLTLSRGALVAFVIGLIILLLKLFFDNFHKIKLAGIMRFFILFLTASLSMVYVVYNTSFIDTIFWRFARLSNLESDTSWQARILHWQENLNLFKESPFIGVGPLRRATFEYAADNEWLLLLRSYGIIGTVYIFTIFFIPHLLNKRSIFNILSLVILLSSSIYMIPAAVFHSLVLMPVVLILISVSEEKTKLISIRRDIY